MKKVIILIISIVAAYAGVMYFSASINGDSEGGITIILKDDNGDIVSTESYQFTSEESLFNFIRSNYQVTCANSNYKPDSSCEFVMLESHVILEIDSLQTNWTGSYLQIFINDVPSQYGVDKIMLEDNTTYTFKYVDLGGGN